MYIACNSTNDTHMADIKKLSAIVSIVNIKKGKPNCEQNRNHAPLT